ncbi:hypothetical protein P175DRAFT_0505161 [Aspergillus ochraceoroseus IBT 24754]|uniref:Uncharacterized protein n=1 Tax=Aspergillus ochraceoroseus IBT 24754 TaxID=1392256 RepID=A0A2T5LL56_9EURO|nr:uncharacterized protein P175DRAFT_0505161 [Aspergillus ochraceoroseus IBT 24754]PTU17022.1 hypothetical protein P175DRAFT_0505161 [Aspergillus ochraceoroseus IBT 24754]
MTDTPLLLLFFSFFFFFFFFFSLSYIGNLWKPVFSRSASKKKKNLIQPSRASVGV